MKKQIELPYGVGDAVYIIKPRTNKIDKSVIKEIVARIDENGIECEYDSEKLYFCSDDVGDTVFATYIEAREMLGKRKDIKDAGADKFIE